MGKQEEWEILGPFARLIWLALTLCFAGLANADDQAGSAAQRHPEGLPVFAQGMWQVIQVPLNWRRKFLPEPVPRQVAVALLAPAAEDIGADNAPCGPPQAVILIVTSDSGRSRTKILFKGDYCSSHWQPPSGMAWAVGPRLSIESIAVEMQPNGDLAISFRMKRSAGHSDDPSVNSEQHGEWSRTLPLEDIRRLVAESPGR